ncbi:MAG: phosphoribosylglycinamide formyltransferase [Bdellovibrionales bacterium RIFOXYD1_FULL_44_7]|nr:MAG: phosphoribosylglycinamide formyltransferase [Bdellovibrionales bacterium RIFOXYD1_FULL_44_7]
MIPIAVLASGRGSNFDAIVNAIEQKTLNASIVALVSDNPKAAVLDKAKQKGINTFVVPFKGREKNDELLLKSLSSVSPRFIVLAGYMRIIGTQLIEAFRSKRGELSYSRITNVHPSLLPAFPGVNSYAQAYRFGVAITGVTVHLVEKEVDNGPICAQRSFSIQGHRSETEVEKNGLEIEHKLYPETLKWVLKEEFDVEKREGRICVRPH